MRIFFYPFTPLLAMGLMEWSKKVIGTADLYRVLGLWQEALDGKVQCGHHKASLQVHSDQVGEGNREEATWASRIWGKSILF